MKVLNMKHSQRGMTYLGLLIILLVIAFFATVLIRVVPLYLESFKVQSSMDSLREEAKSTAMSRAEIHDKLLKRLSINDVTHVTRENIKIEERGGKTLIMIDYEARVPLFANLDIVARFDNKRIELGGF